MIPATRQLLCRGKSTLEVVRWLQWSMNISVSPSFSCRSERFWINVEIVAKCFSFGNNLLCSRLFVSLAGIGSWAAPCPLASGEDAILFDVGQCVLQ